jgi:hypothetical protein
MLRKKVSYSYKVEGITRGKFLIFRILRGRVEDKRF